MTETSRSGDSPADKPSVSPPPGTSRREQRDEAPPHAAGKPSATWRSDAEIDNLLNQLDGPPRSASPRDSPPRPGKAEPPAVASPPIRAACSDGTPPPDNAACSNRPSGSDSPGRRALRPVRWLADVRRSAPPQLRRHHIVAVGSLGIILTAFAVNALHHPPKESSPAIATDAFPSNEARPLAPSATQSLPPSPTPTPTQSPSPTPTPIKMAVGARPAPPTSPPRTSTASASASASPTPSGLPALPPSDAACQKSVDGGAWTTVVFRNERQETIQVYWINHSGERHRYADVAPGESFTVHTFPAHPWVVTENDKDLACYRPATAKATAVVR